MNKVFVICKKVFIEILKFFNPFDIYIIEKNITEENYIQIN